MNDGTSEAYQGELTEGELTEVEFCGKLGQELPPIKPL